MRKEITLVDNQYVKITNIYEHATLHDNGDLIMTAKRPTKPISEWTPAYEKNVKHWVKFADEINAKQNA